MGAASAVYVALQGRLPNTPDRNIAWCWDDEGGWALGVESGWGAKVHVVAYFGDDDVLPVPETVVLFVKAILAGHSAGQVETPVLVCEGLADYASTGICPDEATRTAEATTTRRTERE